MGRLSARRFLLLPASLAAAISWCGCGVLDWVIGGNIDVNGARATISQERAKAGGTKTGYIFLGTQNQFRKVDVVSLLAGEQPCPVPTPMVYDSERQQRCIEWAFNRFYQAGVSSAGMSYGDFLRLRRNEVQERLIAASNSACREFTQHLNTYQSYSNFLLGTAAVGTGAAGAIVSTAVAARALAGVTGAIAGTRAEFNSDLFAKQLVATIVEAIDKSRQDYLLKLRGTEVEGAVTSASLAPAAAPSPAAAGGAGKSAEEPPDRGGVEKVAGATIAGKQSLSIDRYPVEAAIADAIYYNDLCSLDKGLQTLTKSLTTAGNPGLDEFYQEVEKYNKIREALPYSTVAPAKGSSGPSGGVGAVGASH